MCRVNICCTHPVYLIYVFRFACSQMHSTTANINQTVSRACAELNVVNCSASVVTVLTERMQWCQHIKKHFDGLCTIFYFNCCVYIIWCNPLSRCYEYFIFIVNKYRTARNNETIQNLRESILFGIFIIGKIEENKIYTNIQKPC